MERRRVENAVRFFDSLNNNRDTKRIMSDKKHASEFSKVGGNVSETVTKRVSDAQQNVVNISEPTLKPIQKSVKSSDLQQKNVIQCLKLQNYLDVSHNMQSKRATPILERNLIKELETALDLLHKSTENLQNPPDLLLPPDVEAKRIYENFEKQVSPYNTFTISRDVTANEVFKPTFQMFPEVRESFRKIAKEVKSCMRPMRTKRRVERFGRMFFVFCLIWLFPFVERYFVDKRSSG